MFEQTQQQRDELVAKAIEYAGGYVPRNLEVLQRMHDAVFRPLPPTSTHAELAYAEGQRALVAMIIRQTQLALTGSADTPCVSISKLHQTTEPPLAADKAHRKQRRRKT